METATHSVRVIARLDVKGPNLVKGIQFEGLKKLGDPAAYARKYYLQGADELLYIDTVASLYGRQNLVDILRKTTKDVFIPITAGGGVRAVEDVEVLLKAGADKVAVNTGCLKNPKLIEEIAKRFGSQCMVLSIEAKRKEGGMWEAYYDNGREKSGVNAVDWALQGVQLGAGEILVTSVDQEGTQSGFDIELVKSVSQAVPIPVIAGGGMGKAEDAVGAVKIGKADAIAVGSFFHYAEQGIQKTKKRMWQAGIPVRM